MQKVRNWFNSAAMLSVSVIIVKILGAIYKVPLSYMIGEAGLGYFNIAYNIFAFFFLLMNGGVSRALTVTVSRLGGIKEARGYFLYKRIQLLVSILSAAFSFLIFLFADKLAQILGSPGSVACIRAVSPGVLFVGIGCVSRGYLNAHLKLGYIAISQIVESLIKLACGIALGRIGTSLSMDATYISALVISGVSIGAVISCLMQMIACENIYKRHKVGQKGDYTGDDDKEFLGNLIPLSLSSLAASLAGLIDTATILNGLKMAGFSSDESVALYGNYSTLAIPLIALVASVISPLSVEMLPRIAALDNSNEKSAIGTILNAYISLTLIFTLPIAFSFAIYSFEIIDLLYPSNQATRAAELLFLLSPTVILQPLFNIIISYLEGTKRARIASILSFICLILKSLLNIVLLKEPSLSINGAAISTSLTYIVLVCIMLIIVGKDREYGNKRIKVYQLVFGAVIGFIPAFIFIYTCNLAQNSLLSALLAGLISVLIYGSFIITNKDIRLLLFAKYTKKQ